MENRIARLRKALPRLLLELAILLLVMWALEAFLTRHAAKGPAPYFAEQTLAGEAFELRSLQGQPAVIHFWATWCSICGLEQGTIAQLAKDYPLISVAMQSGSSAEVTAYLRKQGLDYPVVNDPEGILAKRYGVGGVPASFILDSQGNIRFVTRGYTSGWGLRGRLWLAGLF